jgi:hypothetical protein
LSRIPLFHGEKQQKPLIPALRRLNPAFQVIDLIGSDAEFPYAAKQRNFFGLTGELNGRTAELQRNPWGADFHGDRRSRLPDNLSGRSSTADVETR